MNYYKGNEIHKYSTCKLLVAIPLPSLMMYEFSFASFMAFPVVGGTCAIKDMRHSEHLIATRMAAGLWEFQERSNVHNIFVPWICLNFPLCFGVSSSLKKNFWLQVPETSSGMLVAWIGFGLAVPLPESWTTSAWWGLVWLTQTRGCSWIAVGWLDAGVAVSSPRGWSITVLLEQRLAWQ